MPRAKFLGYIAIVISVLLCGLYVYSVFINGNGNNESLDTLDNFKYYSVAVPIGLVSLFLVGTGFWIGMTILTIKVVPPMPEIVEKKDYSKIKALTLCTATLTAAVFLIYGIYIKNFWALAIPAGVISFVILGAIFWVGLAIVTTRVTLPNIKKEES